MRNFFETERVIIPFDKVVRVSKALDKAGKVYSVNVFVNGAESGSFSDSEANRFLTEYKRWMDRTPNAPLMMPLGSMEIIEE